jgi:predicted DNA-binding transcriptional regulator AlpA
MDLLTIRDVCEMLGGRDPSSIYRDIAAKRWPKPIKIGAGSRWIKAECLEALARMIEGRAG